MRKPLTLTLIAMAFAASAHAGPFSAANEPPPVGKTDPQLIAWATSVTNYQPGGDLIAAFMDPSKALGPAEGNNFDVVSLGNSGSITLAFDGTLFNGAGYDFAVFENSFSDTFLELAFVQVSSDGANFFRFPHFSLTPSAVGAFGTIDPTNIRGYAGKYRQGLGTPFDLDQLKAAQGLDVGRISHIRLVDVLGDGSESDNSPPGPPLFGPRPIFDPFKTIDSAGFDLDGIGVRYLTPAPVPLPGAIGLFALACAALARRTRLRTQARDDVFPTLTTRIRK